jgi:hypothetical protein
VKLRLPPFLPLSLPEVGELLGRPREAAPREEKRLTGLEPDAEGLLRTIHLRWLLTSEYDPVRVLKSRGDLRPGARVTRALEVLEGHGLVKIEGVGGVVALRLAALERFQINKRWRRYVGAYLGFVSKRLRAELDKTVQGIPLRRVAHAVGLRPPDVKRLVQILYAEGMGDGRLYAQLFCDAGGDPVRPEMAQDLVVVRPPSDYEVLLDHGVADYIGRRLRYAEQYHFTLPCSAPEGVYGVVLRLVRGSRRAVLGREAFKFAERRQSQVLAAVMEADGQTVPYADLPGHSRKVGNRRIFDHVSGARRALNLAAAREGLEGFDAKEVLVAVFGKGYCFRHTVGPWRLEPP